MSSLDPYRRVRPVTRDGLWRWLYAFTGVKVAREPVCRGHQPPFDAFASWFFDNPSLALLLGPRGGGKSFLSAIDTHLKSRWNDHYSTRVLGGSRAQSQQVYEALKKSVWDGSGTLGTDHDAIRALMKQSAAYQNGSSVEILACSSTSVRGPHIPSLKLDEVDEIDEEYREAAMGMNVADKARGHRASCLMTSTWHRIGGPMSGLLEQGRAGKFPVHQFCMFEVLERCPPERSGAHLEKCPECLIQKWCHSDKEEHGGVPKAKRSNGHYEIDAFCQKVISTSPRVFEADYLCTGPRADGLWFPNFTPARHVTDRAEYDRRAPVHLAVDSGVFTGAVLFQLGVTSQGRVQCIVFADYLSENVPAARVAAEILELARVRCNGKLDFRSTDPAGGARNPVGPTVLGEYERAGLRLDRWPVCGVVDSLALLESLVESADGVAGLYVHPSCKNLIAAFAQYSRKKRAGQWVDEPMDTQHPSEDMIDPLRGGLRKVFPHGNRPEAKFVSSTHARNLI